MAGGCAWQGGMHGRGVCVAGGCAWQGGIHGRGTELQMLVKILACRKLFAGGNYIRNF